MALVTATIEIDAPPEAVWEVIMDPTRLEDWVTIHRRLGAVSEGPLRVGSTVEQTLCLRGATFKVNWRLVEVQAPRFARWEGRGPARSRALIEDRLSAGDGERTCFDYRNEFKAPMGPLGAAASRVLVGGLSQREANRSLSRLKELVERRG